MCVFITAVPITTLFAWGEGAGTREEPGTLTQGAPVFPGDATARLFRLMNPKPPPAVTTCKTLECFFLERKARLVQKRYVLVVST